MSPEERESDGVDHFRRYPLYEALLRRRTRRFARGMTIPGGPLAYDSDLEPMPLTEEEEAVLVFAACGLTGPALGDWDFRPEALGELFASFSGRTVSSPDAVHTVSVFVINEEATWLARRPHDLPADLRGEIVGLLRDGEFVEAWRRMRVKVRDERTVPPTDLPHNVPPNKWSLHAEGTTYFLPVYEQSRLMLNIMLGALGEHMGVYFLDDAHHFQPAGLGQYARSKGGHLHDAPQERLALPMSMFERNVAEMCAVEQGMMLQNLGLACQAMGLAGFPHSSQLEPSTWFEALDFRMEEMPSSEYLSVPWPMSWLMQLAGQETTIRYPVGLEREGEVLLKGYCPPYYDSMEEAVRALVDEKFGEGGLYHNTPDAYRNGEPGRGWKRPAEVTREVERVSQLGIDATIDHCEYIWENHGRFPANYPPFGTAVGFQAGHVDEGFYDRFYRPGTLDETHREHMERWHE